MVEPSLDLAVQEAVMEATPKLVDSLLHDARNPLNALAINLEVLTDKLRQSVALGNADKNLRAMREQIFRVDTILRRFADFLAPPRLGPGEAKLSELVEAALEVAGHEARKKRLRLLARVEPGLRVWLPHAWSAHFLTLQTILRAIGRAEPGSDIEVSLSRQSGTPLFAVTEARSTSENGADPAPALQHVCCEIGARLSVHGGECRLAFPSGGRI
jgi:signal transduction histidine kinase